MTKGKLAALVVALLLSAVAAWLGIPLPDLVRDVPREAAPAVSAPTGQ